MTSDRRVSTGTTGFPDVDPGGWTVFTTEGLRERSSTVLLS